MTDAFFDDSVALGLCLVLAALGGRLLAWSWGLRGGWRIAGAAPAVTALLALASTASAVIPFRWHPSSVAVLLLAVALAGLAVRAVYARRHPASSWGWRIGRQGTRGAAVSADASVPLALTLLGTTLIVAIQLWIACDGTFQTVSQTWDAAGHVHAIRGIAETGDASPLSLTQHAYGADGPDSYYPAPFAALAALFQQLTGTNAVVASNLAAILLAGAVWPSSMAIFARVVLGATTRVSCAAAALSLGMWAMPYVPMSFGVLWPTLIGFSVAPLAVSGAVLLMRRDGLGLPRPRRVGLVLLLGGLLLAAVCHPRVGLVVALACATLMATIAAPDFIRSLSSAEPVRRRRAWLTLIALVAAAGAAGWASRRVGGLLVESVPWPIPHRAGPTFYLDLINATAESTPGWGMVALILLGAVAAIRSGRAWLVVAWVVAMAVDTVTATGRWPTIVAITRFWYSDRHRVTELIAIFAVPLAVLGARSVWRLAGIRTRRLASTTGRRILVGAAVLAYLGLIVILPRRADSLSDTYARAALSDASMVSPQERDVFLALPRLVTDGKVIMNNPLDGSMFIPAYSGLTVALPSPWPAKYGWRAFLRDHLVPERNHRTVCQNLAEGRVGWIVNAGDTHRTVMFQPTPALGMQIPAGFWATTLVLDQGGVQLYQVTGCDGERPLR